MNEREGQEGDEEEEEEERDGGERQREGAGESFTK